MPDNTTEYRAKYTQIMQVPAPDDLIAGWYTCAPIYFKGSGDFKRGTLLMNVSRGNVFIPATAEEISTADELAILCNDVLGLEEGQEAKAEAYFSADFVGNRIIIPWETETDSHAELLEAIRVPLRRHGLMLR